MEPLRILLLGKDKDTETRLHVGGVWKKKLGATFDSLVPLP
jgi:hypothetical protein